MSKKKKTDSVVVIVPSQWTIYMVDEDVSFDLYGPKSGDSGMPQGIMLESLVAMGKAKRSVITGMQMSESIDLEGVNDDDGMLGGFDD